MQNPLVSLPSKVPYVIGGINNNKLKRWLTDIGVPNYFHLELNVASIDPIEIEKSAEYLSRVLSDVRILFSVGLFADKVLARAVLAHGVLPSTTTKDKKKVQAAVTECRNYFLGRI